MARSRRRSSTPALTAVPFNDSADSHSRAGFLSGGGPPSRPSEAAPRASVHRLYRIAYSESDPLSLLRSINGAGAPLQALNRSLRLRPVRALPLLPGKRLPHPPPESQRRLAKWWRDFNALQVRVPSKVAFCVRRKQRRETLFALDIAGRRGLGRHGVRRNENSNWSCR